MRASRSSFFESFRVNDVRKAFKLTGTGPSKVLVGELRYSGKRHPRADLGMCSAEDKSGSANTLPLGENPLARHSPDPRRYQAEELVVR